MFLNCQWISEDLPLALAGSFCFSWKCSLGNTVESIGARGKGFPPDPCSDLDYALQLSTAHCVLGFHCSSWKKYQSVCVVSF